MKPKLNTVARLCPIRARTRFVAILAVAASSLATFLPAQTNEPETAKPPSYHVLHAFTGGSDGAIPYMGGLIADRQGDLYGIANSGGVVNATCPAGCGVVFKLDRNDNLTVLHAFAGAPDGAGPAGPLLLDEEGNLFGTTGGGGSAALPAGTVFKIDRFGKESVLYSFDGAAHGNSPISGVISAPNGSLYGTTQAGGAANQGVVFKLDRTGSLKVLYSFTGGNDGKQPGSVLLDFDGTLYGTTQFGGPSNAGVIFKVTLEGTEKVLYAFSGGADGSGPENLLRDVFGNFLGTTSAGGSTNCFFGGCGVVFELTPEGKEKTLYSFQGAADGATPYGRLLLQDGVLYGTTFFGGLSSACPPFGGCGVVYKLSATGKETALYAFNGTQDGANSYTSLVEMPDGTLYGTTGYGGDLASSASACNGQGCGVVFKLTLENALGTRP